MVTNPAPLRSIGYARIGTEDETFDAQLAQLGAAGCHTVYREDNRAASTERPALREMLAALQPGDVVTVTRIDRIARSVFDLFSIVQQIKASGARFRSMAEPLADTSGERGPMFIEVLSGIAEMERQLIRTRTTEGQARNRRRRGGLGRLPALSPEQRIEALQSLAEGTPLRVVAERYNVGETTIRRLMQE